MFSIVSNRLTIDAVYNCIDKKAMYIAGATAVVNHPIYGTVEAVYGKVSGDIPPYCALKVYPELKADGSGFSYVAYKILIGDLSLGCMVAMSISDQTIPDGYYSWFLIHGITISFLGTSLTANQRISHSGSTDGAIPASMISTKTISVGSSVAGSRTILKNGTTQANSPVVYLNDVSDVTTGMAVTGTGIPSLTYVQFIDNAANTVCLTKSATTTATSQKTFNSLGASSTYYNVIFINRSSWAAGV
jgi:hypothetical protein